MEGRNAAILAASGKEAPQPSYITYITNILRPQSDLFGLSACFRFILERFAKKELEDCDCKLVCGVCRLGLASATDCTY